VILHNSEIPYTSIIGKNTIFAYGGIGVIIHSAAVLGERANIGSSVTIGGNYLGVPVIGDDVYISSGCKILGNIKIGNGAIIGANAVVMRDVGPFEVFAGMPAKKVNSITRDNFSKYSGFYWCKGDNEGIERFLNWYFP
jgi:serine O-acetyltransferase